MGAGKVQPSKDVVSRRVGNEIVLVHLQSDEMYSLNATGARAWELLSEGHDVEAIDTTLADEYDVGVEEVRRERETLLDELEQRGLVEPV